jgi:hypothetical protein
MIKRLVAIVTCSMLGVIGAAGVAHSDTVGRYECNMLGTNTPEPIGDRAGHGLVSYQFSCIGVEGLLKGAVYSATHVSEWDGPDGKLVLVGGVHRMPGGLAVTQMQEGTSTIEMKDGKPVGVTGSGKALFKFASGSLASLSGKTLKFVNKSIGFNRFDIEWSE